MSNVLLQDALAFANKVRAAVSAPTLAELPQGRQVSADCCPIAMAMPGDSVSVDGEYAYVDVAYAERLIAAGLTVYSHTEAPQGCYANSEQVGLLLSENTQLFIRRFDRDDYPELVA